jgi:luciferase family oxidoreductase group 1
MIPLSILDLSPVAAGSTGAQGRVDLGVGRGPGTDPATSYALRRRQSGEDDFLERFNELMLLETRGFPAGHPFHNVRAIPEDVPLPPIYLLGSSDYSAQLAGQIGAAFAFAHHFDKFDAAEAMRLYRDTFRPSPAHAKPFAILGTHVICADTDEEAEHLAKSVDLNIVRRAKGEYLPRRLARRRRGLRLHTARPCAHGAEPHAAVGRRARDGEGHADAADRSHAGRRIDGDQHDFRPRSAQAFV